MHAWHESDCLPERWSDADWHAHVHAPPCTRQTMAAPGALSLKEKIRKMEEKIEKKEKEEEAAKQKLKELEEGTSE